jgi:hypothetical protein
MMKYQYHTLILVAVIVLGIVGTVQAADDPAFNSSGVISNVWFTKIVNTNGTYTFDLLPTLYTGLNDYGRMTFVTGGENLSTGDYAIVQVTQNGTEILQVLQLTKYGTITPDYTILTLELTREDLAEPLYIPDGTGTDTTMAQEGSFPAQGTTPAAAATRAPAGMATVLAGLCIAGFIGTLRLRR